MELSSKMKILVLKVSKKVKFLSLFQGQPPSKPLWYQFGSERVRIIYLVRRYPMKRYMTYKIGNSSIKILIGCAACQRRKRQRRCRTTQINFSPRIERKFFGGVCLRVIIITLIRPQPPYFFYIYNILTYSEIIQYSTLFTDLLLLRRRPLCWYFQKSRILLLFFTKIDKYYCFFYHAIDDYMMMCVYGGTTVLGSSYPFHNFVCLLFYLQPKTADGRTYLPTL